jgi:hypothetical protein
LIQKIIQKFLKQGYKKTPKQQGDGKPQMVVNTLLPVSVVQLQEGVRTS